MRLFFKYLLKGLRGGGGFFLKYMKFIPGSITGFYVLITFVYDFIDYGFSYASVHLGKTLLAVELVINENVRCALGECVKGVHSPYGFANLFHIFVSVMIFITVIKMMWKLGKHVGGAQAKYGMIAVFIFLFFIMEQIMIFALVNHGGGEMGFVPIRDSFIFLLENFKAVISVL